MAQILEFPPLKCLWSWNGMTVNKVEGSETRNMQKLKGDLQLHQDNYPDFMFWIGDAEDGDMDIWMP